ncbi:hypothetical protein CABS01_04902 [Colletotrichum abscissum]|uniref:Uncharacterized protein n=1 Tax=Colletotrichum abscissum TaxID=1671311 RepID=A0A9Q0B3P4_9PEZI|nr:uncharacterized protein CABS01_04902 [Colletotrichum abscissum]KAI3553835.1 hypothetical protein CABS02_05873 [Colletotrichum abscissum]KAK1472259.1 hypothetical protein CABS01_04902 [Colletotrichum abscissum]
MSLAKSLAQDSRRTDGVDGIVRLVLLDKGPQGLLGLDLAGLVDYVPVIRGVRRRSPSSLDCVVVLGVRSCMCGDPGTQVNGGDNRASVDNRLDGRLARRSLENRDHTVDDRRYYILGTVGEGKNRGYVSDCRYSFDRPVKGMLGAEVRDLYEFKITSVSKGTKNVLGELCSSV